MLPLKRGASLTDVQDYVRRMEAERGLDHQGLSPAEDLRPGRAASRAAKGSAGRSGRMSIGQPGLDVYQQRPVAAPLAQLPRGVSSIP